MNLLERIENTLIEPLILFLVAIGFLVFVYGIVEFMWGLSSDTESKNNGKQHILWGIVGMFIMAGAYGLLKLMIRILGADIESL